MRLKPFLFVASLLQAALCLAFSWRVTDPAGNSREGAPVCLKDEVDPPGFAFGCSVARGAEGTRGTAFLVLLGALLTAWRVRRRSYFST